MTKTDYYVYALFRPDTQVVFYIGMGRAERWRAHERWVKPGRSHKDNIVWRAKQSGIEVPKIKLATGLTKERAWERERLFIAAIGRECDGGPLVNLTAGGDGIPDPTPEIRARMSDSSRKRDLTPELREKYAANRGRVFDANARANMAAAQTGRVHSEASRHKRRESMLKTLARKRQAQHDAH